MQMSYCVGSVAAIGSCEKGRHVEGTPLLRWSTEPMCRELVVGGVEEASRVSTSPPLFVTFPELTSGRFAAPLLRPSTHEDRSVAS